MRVAVLGPLVVDAPAGLGPRERVVLSALVCSPRHPVSADRLADALWREAPPASWPKVVQGRISRIRRVLGAQTVATTPGGYRLDLPDDDIDALAFERLLARARQLADLGQPEPARFHARRALELWRGPALPELEDWPPAEAVRARLAEGHQAAEELEVEAGLAAGHWREVIALAQEQVRFEPLRERRWHHLALAQHHAGRPGEALATLQRARAVLAGELGLDAGEELLALESAILRQDPVLVPPPSPAAADDSCPYRGLLSFDEEHADSFFGREADLERALTVLGRTGLLAIVGPSGCGKSSLLRAGVVATLRREGAVVRDVPPTAEDPGGWPTGAVVVVDQLETALSTPTTSRGCRSWTPWPSTPGRLGSSWRCAPTTWGRWQLTRGWHDRSSADCTCWAP